MSLLDDVSIVVTPNGYKAGTLFGVIPVPTEGAEEITNGDFATDSDWSKGTGVTISGGNAIFNNSTANNNGVYQGTVFQANTQYKITAEVSNYSSGNVTAWSGSSQNSTSNESFTGNGAKTWIISTGASNGYFLLSSATTNGNFNIDNVSVKEYTAADMDVTRETAATRVDENGLVNYAEVLGAEEITNGGFNGGTSGWTLQTGWTYSVNSVDYDAITNGSGVQSQISTLISGLTYKIDFDLSNIAVASRIGVYNSSGSLNYIAPNSNYTNGSYSLYFQASDSTIGIFAFSVGDSFTITNISVKEVTRDNVPRIDYTGGGCPHILAEPQRTNLLPYSSDFSQWITSGVTLTANASTSPSGSVDSYLVDLSATTDSRLVNNVGVVASTEYTLSFYLKKHESDSNGTFPLAYYDGSNYIKTYVNLTDVWQRFDLTFTNPSGSTFGYGLCRKGTTSDETLTRCYAWGGQLEQASYATSYIPTTGSTVTRNQDIFTRDGIGSLINSTEGVLFVEMAALSNDLSYRYITLSDGTNSNYVIIRYYNNSNRISAYLVNSGYVYGSTAFTISDVTSFSKVAFKWKVNDFALWIDGAERSTQSSGTTFSSGVLNSLYFSEADGSGNTFYGKVKQLQVYKTALTDVQLEALTT